MLTLQHRWVIARLAAIGHVPLGFSLTAVALFPLTAASPVLSGYRFAMGEPVRWPVWINVGMSMMIVGYFIHIICAVVEERSAVARNVLAGESAIKVPQNLYHFTMRRPTWVAVILPFFFMVAGAVYGPDVMGEQPYEDRSLWAGAASALLLAALGYGIGTDYQRLKPPDVPVQ
ncbi:hypothetical protein [Janibacter melonis]|nr:hypothetical protein [Janibacter melonis]